MNYRRPNEVIKACLDYFGFDFKQQKSTQEYVEARRVCLAIMSEKTTLSITRIAEMIGMNKSAAYTCRAQLYERLGHDQRVRDQYEAVHNMLKDG